MRFMALLVIVSELAIVAKVVYSVWHKGKTDRRSPSHDQQQALFAATGLAVGMLLVSLTLELMTGSHKYMSIRHMWEATFIMLNSVLFFGIGILGNTTRTPSHQKTCAQFAAEKKENPT